MADSQLGIKVSIETQADVAAVEKTSTELKKMGTVTDDLDASLARLKGTLNQAEAALKQTGEGGVEAGGKLSAGMKMGAKEAADALGGIMPMTNVNDLVQGAWEIGSQIGSKLGEGIGLAMNDRLSWDNLFGDGLEAEAATAKARERFRDVQKAHEELVEQLNKAPGNAITQFLEKLSEVARETARELANAQKMSELLNKTQATADQAAFDDKRQQIEESGASKGDKIREKAEVDNEQAELERQRRSEERKAEIRKAEGGVNRAIDGVDSADAAVYEASKRKQDAFAIDGDEQIMRARQSKTDPKVIADMYERRAREMGYDDLGTPAQEDANETKAKAAAKAARERLKAAESEEKGLKERLPVEEKLDAARTGYENQRRTEKAEREAGAADKGDAGKEASEAGKAAKDASRDVDSKTKAVEAGLKKVIDEVKGVSKAHADALQDMAADLKDGASQAELNRIKDAMKQVAQSQNENYAALGQAVESMVNAVESSTQIAQDAKRKAEALEAKVNNMR